MFLYIAYIATLVTYQYDIATLVTYQYDIDTHLDAYYNVLFSKTCEKKTYYCTRITLATATPQNSTAVNIKHQTA
jgi:hypothetical protein